MTRSHVRQPPIAVIFDLDGVLTDTAAAHASAWHRLAQIHGYAVTNALLDTLRGRSRAGSLTVLLGDVVVTSDAFARLLEEKNRYYLEEIQALSPHDQLPGARDAVQTARDLGAFTAVGSASKNARMVLDRLAMTPLFDTIVDGNDVTFAKPDPAVFMQAAQRLNVAVQRCAVIEDASAGIAAANAAGMVAVGLGAHVDASACQLTANALEQLDMSTVIALLEQS